MSDKSDEYQQLGQKYEESQTALKETKQKEQELSKTLAEKSSEVENLEKKVVLYDQEIAGLIDQLSTSQKLADELKSENSEKGNTINDLNR